MENNESHWLAGVKRALRAVTDGSAKLVLVADDADPFLLEPLMQLCAEKEVPVATTATMRELGERCKISTGAAAAVEIGE